MARVGGRDLGGDAIGESLRRGRREQVSDRGVHRRGGRQVAALERIAMHGRHADPRLGGQERPDVRDPVRGAARGSSERNVREGRADPRVVALVGGEVVPRWAARHVDAAPGRVPTEACVQLGLVSELQSLDRGASDPRHQLAGFGGGDGCAVRLEVDAEDQPRVQLVRERGGDACERGGEAVPDPSGLADAGDGPPGPVGGITADPYHWSLTGREVADQLYEHRIDRLRVKARVLLHGRILEREAQKPGRNWPPGGAVAHGERQHGLGRVCAAPLPALAGARTARVDQAGRDRDRDRQQDEQDSRARAGAPAHGPHAPIPRRGLC